MKAKESLLKKKQIVEDELDRILSGKASLLIDAMRYAVLSGGKRFRPLLLLSTGTVLGADQKNLLPFACAIELIHNYSLIHDDLPSMDNDDYRRGRLSCHKKYGEDIALLAGDCLLTRAFEVMADAAVQGPASGHKIKAIQIISQSAGLKGMIGGQLMDIRFSPETISSEEMIDLIMKKTAALIIASAQVGAVLAKAKEEEWQAICVYGQKIGLAFQIRDDLQDMNEDRSDDHPQRPNSVSLYGEEEAKQRVKMNVEEGVGALDKARINSEELRYLGFKLLELFD